MINLNNDRQIANFYCYFLSVVLVYFIIYHANLPKNIHIQYINMNLVIRHDIFGGQNDKMYIYEKKH